MSTNPLDQDAGAVPLKGQRRVTTLEAALEAVAHLGRLRRPRAPILHRKVHRKACSGGRSATHTREEH
jgi:hypothetical protein